MLAASTALLGALALSTASRGGAAGAPRALVPDLNAAPERHLLLLPGIGPARARAIVEERERGGPFASVEDLGRVRGIGPATASALAPLVRVPGPQSPTEGDP